MHSNLKKNRIIILEISSNIEKITRLNTFIEFVKTNKVDKPQSDIKLSFERVNLVFSELKLLRDSVYNNRYNEAKELFFKNKDSIKISCFELMEHNFYENSHTNVLQYLFDFRYSGSLGADILQKFLQKIETDDSKKIASLVKNYTYRTERETSIGNGRMDLLIVDEKAKFVVMIENKVLSGVIEKGNNDLDENETSEAEMRTQLTNYKEYIYSKYPGFTTLLVLLSYRSQDVVDEKYVLTDYNFLKNVLADFHMDNNVLVEYKMLLKSLTDSKVDRIGALGLGYEIFHDRESASATLHNLQIIKTSFYA